MSSILNVLFNHGFESIMYLYGAISALGIIVATIWDITKFSKRHLYFHKYMKSKNDILTKIEAYESGVVVNISDLRKQKNPKKYPKKYA